MLVRASCHSLAANLLLSSLISLFGGVQTLVSQQINELDVFANKALDGDENVTSRSQALERMILANDPRAEMWPEIIRNKALTSAQAISILRLLNDYRYRQTGGELLALLTDSKLIFGIRVAAATALTSWGDKRALGPIVELLTNSTIDSTLRELLISALGQLRDPASQQLLSRIMSDNLHTRGERVAAAEALVKLGNKKAVDFVFAMYAKVGGEADAGLFERLTQAIASIGDERAVAALSERTGGLANETIAVIAAMGRIRSPRFVVPLLQILQDSDQEPHVRIAAANGLMGQFERIPAETRVKFEVALRKAIMDIADHYPDYVDTIKRIKASASEVGLRID